MAKQHYFFKLIPPCPRVPHDMNDHEVRLMEEHGRYFYDQLEAGKIPLCGPVIATGGAFGLAILEVDSEAEARGFGEGAPSVRARTEQVRDSSHARFRRTRQTAMNTTSFY